MRKDIKKLAQQIEAELEEVERICKLNGYEKPVVISVDLNISYQIPKGKSGWYEDEKGVMREFSCSVDRHISIKPL